ncbi:hypothetical protein [Mycobacterium intracellulare]|uniref:hypothetical protein n=1 Tax=Mycobacterium intracellulare TaxID=1767 RepID=UPI0035E1CF28|nr:DUF732 domain-containing protein [Mycobacterium intracellulare]
MNLGTCRLRIEALFQWVAPAVAAIGAAVVVAIPAHADSFDDLYFRCLSRSGITVTDKANALQIGQDIAANWGPGRTYFGNSGYFVLQAKYGWDQATAVKVVGCANAAQAYAH